jgi:tetratricopeptide (TPR) repeat protein
MSDEAIGAALERAGQALAEGDLDRAEAAFYAALEMAPGDGTLLGGLAVVSMQRGDMEEAARRGRVAVDAGARGVEVPYNLGFALLQLDRREEAVDAFLAAFALDPTRPEPIGQLLQLGRVPAQEGEEPGEPLALETLERLELYQHLALRQAGGAEVDSFEGAWVWATERGAPWGRTAAWLMQQGAHCDREVLARLPERDEHLARSVVAGLILAPNDVAEAALRELPGVILIGPDDPVPELPEPAEHPGGDFLVVRLDPVADRPQIPSQRTHAAVVFSALVDRLHAFGSESAVVLTVDPAAHVGPRRAWVITPVSEAEVVAEWSGADVEGRPLDEPLLPGADPVPAATMPLSLPGLDPASLAALAADAGFVQEVRPDPNGGALYFDADAVGRRPAEWVALLTRLARLVPRGSASLALWREGGTEKMAVLHREGPPDVFTLKQSWPTAQSKLDLPAPMEVQLMARALFEAPRSGKRYGA